MTERCDARIFVTTDVLGGSSRRRRRQSRTSSPASSREEVIAQGVERDVDLRCLADERRQHQLRDEALRLGGVLARTVEVGDTADHGLDAVGRSPGLRGLLLFQLGVAVGRGRPRRRRLVERWGSRSRVDAAGRRCQEEAPLLGGERTAAAKRSQKAVEQLRLGAEIELGACGHPGASAPRHLPRVAGHGRGEVPTRLGELVAHHRGLAPHERLPHAPHPPVQIKSVLDIAAEKTPANHPGDHCGGAAAARSRWSGLTEGSEEMR